MSRIVGIDLGTSTSAVAVMDHGQARILVLDERERVIPTVVGLSPAGDVLVGAVARDQLETNPDFTFTGLKRLLGRKHDDPQIAEWAKFVAYEIVPGPHGEAYVRGPDRIYSPIELLSHVFAKLRDIAQQSTGEPIERCVVGVPAHFDIEQKDAVRQAAKLGGLEVARLLPEPTAAAVAYGVDRASNRTIAIYDMGGGTFDVTILSIRGKKFQTLATAGDPFLGGEDFDQRIFDWSIERFKAKHGIDLRDDPGARNRVRIVAERAKEALSAETSHRIFSKYIAHRPLLLDLDEVLERTEFEDLVADLVDRTRQPCREALRRAKRDVRDIDEVVLVGGMTRMPLIREQVVREIFERQPSRKIDPVAAVALGCALQGAALAGDLKSMALSETTVLPFSVQVGNDSVVPLIKANSQLPARQERIFGVDNKDAERAAIRIFHGSRRVMTMVLNDVQEQVRVEPLIKVVLDVDDSGMLTATARNVATKSEISHRLHAETGMSESELAGLRDVDDEGFEEGAAA